MDVSMEKRRVQEESRRISVGEVFPNLPSMYVVDLIRDERDASLEEQLRLAQEKANQESWLRVRGQIMDRKIADLHEEMLKVDAHSIIGLLPESMVPATREAMKTGLKLEDFVDVVARAVRENPNFVEKDQHVLNRSLTNLFCLIDTNGNGSVDWEEFTHFVLASYQARKEEAQAAYPWKELCAHREPADRCKRRRCYFYPDCDRYVVLDTHHVNMEDSSRLSVLYPHHPTNSLRLHATFESSYTIEAAEWLPEFQLLAASTSNSLIRWLHVGTVSDERSKVGKIVCTKHNYVEGRQLQLRWDSESGLLFSGNREGYLFGIRPDETYNEIPNVEYRQQPHITDGSPHPVVDLLPLPAVGSKKVVSCGLNGSCLINDISTGKVVLELGGGTPQSPGAYPEDDRPHSITNLAFSPELSLLVTSGWHDPEPILWTPLGGQFISRLRDLDQPHRGRILSITCMKSCSETAALKGYHVLSIDSQGMHKLWDLRKVACLQSWTLDEALGITSTRADQERLVVQMHREENTRMTIYDTAVDATRGWIMTASRFGAEKVLHVQRQELGQARNPYSAHDDRVAGVHYNPVTRTFLTFAKRSATVWDASTGAPRDRFSDIVSSEITASALDENGRRFIVGTHAGRVSVHSYATGAVTTAYNALRGKGEVTALVQVPQNQMIAVAYHSGSLACFSEEEGASLSPILTLSTGGTIPVPKSSLMCVAKCPYLSLFLVGTAENTVVLFDTNSVCRGRVVATLSPKDAQHRDPPDDSQPGDDAKTATDRHIHACMNPSRDEVSCVVPLEPFPLLAVADFAGYMAFWTTRPHAKPNRCVGRWHVLGSFGSVWPVVTSMVFHDYRLYLGDDRGTVSTLDVSALIQGTGCVATRFPTQREISSVRPHAVTASAVSCPRVLASFSIGKGQAVSAMTLIAAPVSLFVISADQNVLLFTLDGRLAGRLEQGRSLAPTNPDPHYSVAHRHFEAVGMEETREGEGGEQDSHDGSSFSVTPSTVGPVCPGNAFALVVSAKQYAEMMSPPKGWVGKGDLPPHQLGDKVLEGLTLRHEDELSKSTSYVADEPAAVDAPTPCPTPARREAVQAKYVASCGKPKHTLTNVLASPTSLLGRGAERGLHINGAHRTGGTAAARALEHAKLEEDEAKRRADEIANALREASAKLSSMVESLSSLIDANHVVVFRRSRLPVFDIPLLSTALSSSPSARLNWAEAIREGHRVCPKELADAVLSFTPHIIQAPNPDLYSWSVHPKLKRKTQEEVTVIPLAAQPSVSLEPHKEPSPRSLRQAVTEHVRRGNHPVNRLMMLDSTSPSRGQQDTSETILAAAEMLLDSPASPKPVTRFKAVRSANAALLRMKQVGSGSPPSVSLQGSDTPSSLPSPVKRERRGSAEPVATPRRRSVDSLAWSWESSFHRPGLSAADAIAALRESEIERQLAKTGRKPVVPKPLRHSLIAAASEDFLLTQRQEERLASLIAGALIMCCCCCRFTHQSKDTALLGATELKPMTPVLEPTSGLLTKTPPRVTELPAKLLKKMDCRKLYRPPMSCLNPRYLKASVRAYYTGEGSMDQIARTDVTVPPAVPSTGDIRKDHPDLDPVLLQRPQSAPPASEKASPGGWSGVVQGGILERVLAGSAGPPSEWLKRVALRVELAGIERHLKRQRELQEPMIAYGRSPNQPLVKIPPHPKSTKRLPVASVAHCSGATTPSQPQQSPALSSWSVDGEHSALITVRGGESNASRPHKL